MGLWHCDVQHSLVLGFADVDAYASNDIYAGAIVGPVANRITNATLDISGTRYDMPANEGSTCLHSGAMGLHNRQWDIVTLTDSLVTLRCVLHAGDIGLPGRRTIDVTYDLADAAALDLKIRATSDRETVMNIAHHPYWSLDGMPDISGHVLTVAAQSYLPVNAAGLPTGLVAPVAQTDYDFTSPRRVPVNTGLDCNLCLDDKRRADLRTVAFLKGANGLEMRISTTEPGLQLYNASALPFQDKPLIDGRRLAPFSGLALEPQGWPDAPNNPAFPSIILSPKERYFQHSRYEFGPIMFPI